MTDAQLEAAARRYCRLQGIDPDESTPHGADPDPRTGFVPAILLYSPAWMLWAKEVKRIYHAILAIEQAMMTEGKNGDTALEDDQFKGAKPAKNHEKT